MQNPKTDLIIWNGTILTEKSYNEQAKEENLNEREKLRLKELEYHGNSQFFEDIGNPKDKKREGNPKASTRLFQKVSRTTKSVDECTAAGLCWHCGERKAEFNLDTTCDRCWFYQKNQYTKNEFKEPAKPIEFKVDIP